MTAPDEARPRGGLFARRNLARLALVYAGAVACGYLAARLGVPLPWMIGPMVFAGAVSIGGLGVSVPVVTRTVGQIVVAATVGLSFTPLALAAVSEQLVAMLAVALLTIVLGFIAAAVLMRLTRIDLVSASLASIPGGPVEMASLAARHGVAPGPVAMAQTLRIALLVLIVPPFLVALDGGPVDARAIFAAGPVDYRGALLLLAIATAGGFAFRWTGIASPFFLGPLGLSAGASALLLPVAMPPYWLLASAQVLLGVWLGCMLDKALFTRAPGFLPAVLASTALLLVMCAAMAVLFSHLTGIDWRTMLLATAPGSVTEMALTAKLLQQGVATVTAFHVIRIFIIIPSAPLLFLIMARLVTKLQGAKDQDAKGRGAKDRGKADR